MALKTANGVIQLLSRTDDGYATTSDSDSGAISDNGRYVAFRSTAALVAEDTDVAWDAYLLDRQTNHLTLLSQASNGDQTDDGVLGNIRISGDGRFVAFGMNDASDLVGGPAGAGSVMYDRSSDMLNKFSTEADAAEGHFTSSGNFVYDETQTLNCSGSSTEAGSARLFNPTTNVATTIVTHCQAPGSVRDPDLSADGEILAYQMITSGYDHFTYVPYEYYIYTYNTDTDADQNITMSADGTDANGASYSPSISDNGRFVAFTSDASNLTMDDANGVRDVFLYDRTADTMTNVTEGANGGSGSAEISGDGRYITFDSAATNLVDSGRSTTDTYVYDRVDDTIIQINPPSPSYYNSGNPMKSDAANVFVFDTKEGYDPDEIHAYNKDVYLADMRFGSSADTATLKNWGETVFGMGGNDRITGGTKRDIIHGGSGADQLKGARGADKLYGDGGNDILKGGSGADKAFGGKGHDTLFGGLGNDTLKGLGGRDTFKGGGGKDHMFAGNDNQTDRFVFLKTSETVTGAKHDVIHQFDHGEDRIVLTAIDANVTAGGNQAFGFSGTTAKAHSVWRVDTGKDLLLRGDVDGNKVADFEIQLTDLNRLDAGDIVL